jgi:hypothetical protein
LGLGILLGFGSFQQDDGILPPILKNLLLFEIGQKESMVRTEGNKWWNEKYTVQLTPYDNQVRFL